MIMITLQNQTTVFVGTSAGEIALTNAGSWSLADLEYVAAGTNEAVEVGALREGSVVQVDAAGVVTIMEGPDLAAMAIWGFSTAFLSIGVMLAFLDLPGKQKQRKIHFRLATCAEPNIVRGTARSFFRVLLHSGIEEEMRETGSHDLQKLTFERCPRNQSHAWFTSQN